MLNLKNFHFHRSFPKKIELIIIMDDNNGIRFLKNGTKF